MADSLAMVILLALFAWAGYGLYALLRLMLRGY
jgi:hypothetical protein